MLLRNYYALDVARIINATNITEVVSEGKIAPSMSRAVNGNYARKEGASEYYKSIACPYAISNHFINNSDYGTGRGLLYLVLGIGDNAVNFDDYTLTLNTKWSGKYVSQTIVYNENTSTYTAKAKYVITNTDSSNAITFKEFGFYMSGIYSDDTASGRLILRELLGENEFTLEPLESANFELTVNFTIPSILQ